MTTPSPPPGWYPNPSGEAGQRYWDGNEWTIVNVPPTPPRPPAAVPRTRSSMGPLKILAIIGAIIFGLVGGCTACAAMIFGGHTSSTTPTSTTAEAKPNTSQTVPGPPTSETASPPGHYSRDGHCNGDITPKLDGTCLVNHGGFFDIGILPGWIESSGPSDPEHYPNCMWERLSGPDPGDISTIIESDLAEGSKGRTRVHNEQS